MTWSVDTRCTQSVPVDWGIATNVWFQLSERGRRSKWKSWGVREADRIVLVFIDEKRHGVMGPSEA